MKRMEFTDNIQSVKHSVKGFALKLTKNEEDAKDLCQATYLRAYDKRDNYTSGSNFKAWITTIMRNLFINNYRKRRTRIKHAEQLKADPGFNKHKTTKNQAGSRIMLKELHNLLRSIRDNQRIPFNMHTQGYAYKEISDTLGLPIGTVKSRIHFARKNMRGLIRRRYGTVAFRQA